MMSGIIQFVCQFIPLFSVFCGSLVSKISSIVLQYSPLIFLSDFSSMTENSPFLFLLFSHSLFITLGSLLFRIPSILIYLEFLQFCIFHRIFYTFFASIFLPIYPPLALQFLISRKFCCSRSFVRPSSRETRLTNAVLTFSVECSPGWFLPFV